MDLEKKPAGTGAASAVRDAELRQRRRILVTLALLLIALAIVLIRNRDDWFASPEETTAEIQPVAAAPLASSAPVSAPVPAMSPSNDEPKLHAKGAERAANQTKAKTTSKAATKKSNAKAIQLAGLPASANTFTPSISRTALPPLQVEVVAGDQRRAMRPVPPATVRVDTSTGAPNRAEPGTEPVPGEPSTVPSQAAERVRMSPEAVQVLSHPVEPNYPLLAKEMKVQGSVVLQVVISREGTIQDLRVVSGPTILANAAMEAVRQWRFKPYIQNGEAVETEARITVNFTISTT